MCELPVVVVFCGTQSTTNDIRREYKIIHFGSATSHKLMHNFIKKDFHGQTGGWMDLWMGGWMKT